MIHESKANSSAKSEGKKVFKKKATTNKATTKKTQSKTTTKPNEQTKVISLLQLLVRDVGELQHDLQMLRNEIHGNGHDTAPSEAQLPLTEQTANPPVEKTKVTKEQCTQALQNVSASHGMDICKQLLKKFDAQRIVDLTPEQYSLFVTSCKDVVSNANTSA